MRSLLFFFLVIVQYEGLTQGIVNFANTPGTRITTNGVALGLGNGLTAPTANTYYYSLFMAPLGTTNTDLTSGLWAFTGVYATNILFAGRLNGGVPVTVPNWLPGQTNAFMIAGWSANLGHDWSDIYNQLLGAQFIGGGWIGNWVGPGFYGQSSIGFGIAGGGPIPPPSLFGSVPYSTGTPVSGFTLWVVINGPTTGIAPVITRQPTSSLAYWGKSASLAVAAAGSGTLTYQWYHDGSVVAGATGSSLAFTAVQLSDAGTYHVVVTNEYGSTTSSNAVMSVNPAGVTLGTYAGLSIDGVVGNTYAIQYSTNFISWVTLTNLTLTQPVVIWVDTAIKLNGHEQVGAYRVLPVP